MRNRRGYAEAPQDQVVVRVVPCAPYFYFLEHTTVSAQDVVGLGAHLPAAPVHGPCAVVLQLRLVSWEEVAAYVFHSTLRHGLHNPLVPLLSLWCGQVGVEITVHQ